MGIRENELKARELVDRAKDMAVERVDDKILLYEEALRMGITDGKRLVLNNLGLQYYKKGRKTAKASLQAIYF